MAGMPVGQEESTREPLWILGHHPSISPERSPHRRPEALSPRQSRAGLAGGYGHIS